MRFRSRQRMSRQADFAAVRKKGRRQFGAAFVFSALLRAASPSTDLPRFAVVVSRRVGGAVERNLLKRRLRAIFREHQHLFPPAADVVVTCKPGSASVSFENLQHEFLAAARRCGFGTGAGQPGATPPPQP